MSSSEGGCGRGGRDYTGAESVLAGVLASDVEAKYYPDNYCYECIRLGRDLDKCFHWHWSKEAKSERKSPRTP